MPFLISPSEIVVDLKSPLPSAVKIIASSKGEQEKLTKHELYDDLTK